LFAKGQTTYSTGGERCTWRAGQRRQSSAVQAGACTHQKRYPPAKPRPSLHRCQLSSPTYTRHDGRGHTR
jgi:hypothetical protein